MRAMERWLERNLAVKVLSVFLALVLWFQVMREENPVVQETFEEVPLRPEGLGAGLVILDQQPRLVSLKVQGQARVVRKMTTAQLKATVELSELGPGVHWVPVKVEMPRGVELVQVSPAEVMLQIDRLVQQNLPVQVRLEGKVHEDFRHQDPRVHPEVVMISGPASLVEAVASVWVRVSLQGAREDLSVQVEVRPLDETGREVAGVHVEPKAVTVEIPVVPLPPAKMVTVQPVLVGQPAPGYEVSSVACQPARVKVRAPQDRLARIGAAYTEAISVAGRSEDLVHTVRVIMPEGATHLEPTTVRVTVQIAEKRERLTFEDIPVRLRNVAAGLRWQILPPEVSVTVEGRSAAVQAIDPLDVEAYVDVANLGPGRYQLTVSVSPLEGVEIEEVLPDQVTVILEPR